LRKRGVGRSGFRESLIVVPEVDEPTFFVLVPELADLDDALEGGDPLLEAAADEEGGSAGEAGVGLWIGEVGLGPEVVLFFGAVHVGPGAVDGWLAGEVVGELAGAAVVLGHDEWLEPGLGAQVGEDAGGVGCAHVGEHESALGDQRADDRQADEPVGAGKAERDDDAQADGPAPHHHAVHVGADAGGAVVAPRGDAAAVFGEDADQADRAERGGTDPGSQRPVALGLGDEGDEEVEAEDGQAAAGEEPGGVPGVGVLVSFAACADEGVDSQQDGGPGEPELDAEEFECPERGPAFAGGGGDVAAFDAEVAEEVLDGDPVVLDVPEDDGEKAERGDGDGEKGAGEGASAEESPERQRRVFLAAG